ncbi:transcription factor Atoh8-like [Ornithodoros turicata]|uniref:transcription factor Atoh8-like n=1 Tax=Ornithodoros turicata TaxID=34597 RepID=UPI0031398565
METVPDALSSDDSGVYVAPSSRRNKRKSSEPRRRREVLKLKSSSPAWNESDSEAERPSSGDSGIRADDKVPVVADLNEAPRKRAMRQSVIDPVVLECSPSFAGVKQGCSVDLEGRTRKTPSPGRGDRRTVGRKEDPARSIACLPKKRPYEAQEVGASLSNVPGSGAIDTCLDLTAHRTPLAIPKKSSSRPSSSSSKDSQLGTTDFTLSTKPSTSASPVNTTVLSRTTRVAPVPSASGAIESPYTCRLISPGTANSSGMSSSPEPSPLPHTSAAGPSFSTFSSAPFPEASTESYHASRSRKGYATQGERPFDASDIELIPRTAMRSNQEEARCSPAKKTGNGMSRQRRIEANARERTRVHTISAAFEALRRAVPAYADNQKLSKLAILRIAAAYIVALARLNDRDYSCDQRAPSFAECIEVCTRTIQMEGKARRRPRESLDLSS